MGHKLTKRKNLIHSPFDFWPSLLNFFRCVSSKWYAYYWNRDNNNWDKGRKSKTFKGENL